MFQSPDLCSNLKRVAVWHGSLHHHIARFTGQDDICPPDRPEAAHSQYTADQRRGAGIGEIHLVRSREKPNRTLSSP